MDKARRRSDGFSPFINRRAQFDQKGQLPLIKASTEDDYDIDDNNINVNNYKNEINQSLLHSFFLLKSPQKSRIQQRNKAGYERHQQWKISNTNNHNKMYEKRRRSPSHRPTYNYTSEFREFKASKTERQSAQGQQNNFYFNSEAGTHSPNKQNEYQSQQKYFKYDDQYHLKAMHENEGYGCRLRAKSKISC